MNTQQPQPHAVIVHGSAESFALHSRSIAANFGCDHVVRDFTPLRSPLVPRGLHLATSEPDPARFAPDICVISLECAVMQSFTRGHH